MIWRRIESIGVVVLSFTLFIAMVVVGFFMFIDGDLYKPPVIYDTTTLQTDRTSYKPGDLVSVLLDVTKTRDIEGCVTWSLVNGRVFPYAKRKLSSPSGTYEKWFTLSHEPLPTANLNHGGLYHYEALVEYRVNPLRTVTYKLRTTPFTITDEVPK